jgi:hypothetical protein
MGKVRNFQKYNFDFASYSRYYMELKHKISYSVTGRYTGRLLNENSEHVLI